jgi:hypothetical protein
MFFALAFWQAAEKLGEILVVRKIRIQRSARLNPSCAIDPGFESMLRADTPSKPLERKRVGVGGVPFPYGSGRWPSPGLERRLDLPLCGRPHPGHGPRRDQRQ